VETGNIAKRKRVAFTVSAPFITIPTSPALRPSSYSNMPTPAFALPRFYTAFFLIIEPISALVGAFYAHFRPLEYLQLTHTGSAPSWESTIPLSTSIVLSQLANLYLLFAINEALVLRSTSDLRVWKTVLFGLLLADFGHLYSVKGLGADIYWNVLKWNRMDWGNVGFVYAGATMRMLFLAGFGMDTAGGREAAERVARRANLEKSK